MHWVRDLEISGYEPMLVDLHSHSTASDGSLSPTELAQEFSRHGVQIAALTDHDTVGGAYEFLQACKKFDIIGITGIEFSTVFRGREVHLLGYGLPLDDPRCSAFLENHGIYLRNRCTSTINMLREFGFELDIDEVYEHSKGNPPMPPHIIKAVATHGHIHNWEDALSFFHEYLASGAKAWMKHDTPIEEPMKMLLDVGAKAIVAHPLRFPDLTWLEDLLDMGAHGFELFYPGQTGKIFRELEAIAGKRDCLVTGGCDFHGAFAARKICEVKIPLEVGINLLLTLGHEIPAALSGRGGVAE